MSLTNLFLMSALLTAILCSPYDDGKYNPKKYKIYDDGKYYRPLDEGKYIPTDEGKYTYIYQQFVDGDYRYIHQLGPYGGNGGFGGNGGTGGNGGDGPNGPTGPGGPSGSSKEFIGRRIYAERYPYIHKVIKALIDEYVSYDVIASDGSSNHYSKVFANKGVAAKCRYLAPTPNDKEFVTEYPPRLKAKEGETLGSYYSFKGTKVLSTVSNSLTNKLKLEYEVIVRIVEEVTK